MDNNNSAPQNPQQPSPQVVQPTPTPQQPAFRVMSSNKSHSGLLYSVLFLIVLVAAVAGIYFWQHSKIGQLNQKVTSLQEQLKAKQSPKTSPTATNSGTIQQNARNAKRQTDLMSLQTQIEAFFSQNGYYPSLADMNNSTWLAANMKSLDKAALTDPSNTTGSTKLAASPTKGQYSYQPVTASGASCESNDQNCADYTLTAVYEGQFNGSSTDVLKNLD